MTRTDSMLTPSAVAASAFFAEAFPEAFAEGVTLCHKRAWKIGDDAAAVAAVIFPAFIFADAEEMTSEHVRVAAFAACKRAAATAAADRKRAAAEDARFTEAFRAWCAESTDNAADTTIISLANSALSTRPVPGRMAQAIAHGHNDAEVRRLAGLRTSGKGGVTDKGKVTAARDALRESGKLAVWAAAGYPVRPKQTGGGTMIWGMGGGFDGSGLMSEDGTPFAGPVTVTRKG